MHILTYAHVYNTYLHIHTFCIDVYVCSCFLNVYLSMHYTFTHISVVSKTIGIDPEAGH